MDSKTWTTEDKTAWGDGPWQAEPDKEQFTDELTGLPCLIKRNGSGALCGYVGVAEGHPWFGQNYYWPSGYDADGNEVALPPALQALSDVSVHGGLTYSGFCQPGDQAKTICHVPAPGEPDRVWWLGFDCAHGGDLTPAYQHHLPANLRRGDVYRDLAYVKAQCAGLAAQAKAAASL